MLNALYKNGKNGKSTAPAVSCNNYAISCVNLLVRCRRHTAYGEHGANSQRRDIRQRIAAFTGGSGAVKRRILRALVGE